MAHGNIYPPEKVDAALGNYFRVGNLTALRELALLWLADKVDDQLDRYRAEHDISATWETRERVVVALTGGPEGDTLVRRAARIAARAKGADLLAVHVTPQRRPGRRATRRTWPASARWSRAWAAPTTRWSATDVAERPARLRPRRQRHPAGAGGRAGAAGSPRCSRPGSGSTTTARVRADRRAPGHPRGGATRPAPDRAPTRAALSRPRRLAGFAPRRRRAAAADRWSCAVPRRR